MNKLASKKWFFILVFFGPILLSAQEKLEREYRIKEKNVPAAALAFMDSLGINVKTKWYTEESLDRKSIEVKFKFEKRRYSIEFDTFGRVEDVEVTRRWKAVEKNTQNRILMQLMRECTKYKIEKIQFQYIGLEKHLYEIIKNPNAKTPLQMKYELIVKCKSNGGVDLYEYLFNSQGDTVSKSKIIFKNSSHLEY